MDWGGIITNGLQAEDQHWIEAGRHEGNILDQARALLSKVLEYDCVDDRGRDQGQALARLFGLGRFLTWPAKGRALEGQWRVLQVVWKP